MYILSGKIRRGIHMCDKTDGLLVFIALCGREQAVYIAVLIAFYPGEPQFSQLVRQGVSKLKLPVRAGDLFLAVAGRSPIRDVF